MALAGRTPRRRGAKWWLGIGIVLTLLVLFVDASLKSRSPGPVTTLAGQTWVDRVLPIIGQSTAQGDVINRVRASGLTMPAATITAELDQVSSGAAAAFRAARALHPPATTATASGALIVCLQTRAQAANTLDAAMKQALSAPATGQAAAAAPAIQTAGQQFQVADQAYRLFLQDVPRLGVRLPSSAWYTDPAEFAEPGLTTYLDALRAVTSATPVHDVAVEAVTTSPPAVTSRGGLQILPPSTFISIQATVADIGNQAEANLPIVAALTPPPAGYASSVRDNVDLSPGQDLTLTLGSLKVTPNVAETLTVTLGPAPGETATADNTSVLHFQMP
jgi:hypothetical protein